MTNVEEFIFSRIVFHCSNCFDPNCKIIGCSRAKYLLTSNIGNQNPEWHFFLYKALNQKFIIPNDYFPKWTCDQKIDISLFQIADISLHCFTHNESTNYQLQHFLANYMIHDFKHESAQILRQILEIQHIEYILKIVLKYVFSNLSIE